MLYSKCSLFYIYAIPLFLHSLCPGIHSVTSLIFLFSTGSVLSSYAHACVFHCKVTKPTLTTASSFQMPIPCLQRISEFTSLSSILSPILSNVQCSSQGYQRPLKLVIEVYISLCYQVAQW